MALSQGDHLGPHEIVGLVGAGGMGEVYRARDPRLDREVAIKVLPEDVAHDSEHLRRFEKEAKAAGALNHPNVLAIYDVGTHEGRPYLVTELLEGDTLRERLTGAALPAQKAVDFAVQIARGLAAAHDKGIVHRDLKPENLFVTKDGLVKILDFGLAKLRGPQAPPKGTGDEEETASRTTDTGAVIGTAGYMSPEQVRGQVVDHRSDIFSFGAVLYEMLSGRRAFQGDSGVEVLNAILKEEPAELVHMGRDAPPALVQIVRRCLEKRPSERFDTAHDLLLALEASSGLPHPVRRPVPEGRRWVLWSSVLAPFVVVAIAGSVLLRSESARPWLGRDEPVATIPQNRVFVAPFENRTGDPALDILGRVASESVTRGVALSGICDVVPAMSVVLAVQAAEKSGASWSTDTVQTLAEQAGATLLVTGAYYAQEESLRFETELTDLAEQTLIDAWEQVGEPGEEPADAVESLRQRLLGALAVHLDLPKLGLDPRLLSKPPVFEAYQQWSTGIELMWQDPNQGLEHLRRATELDPEFAPPWLTIADEHINQGDCAEADRILRRLEQKRHRLTPYEHLLLKIRRARLDGRFAEAQRLSIQLEELVPNDLQANFWVVVFSIDANRPQDAIDAYARLTHGPWEKHYLNILRSWWVQYSYHRLGRHEEELRETEGVVSFDLDPWTQPTAKVPALAALGRTDELERLLGVTATLPAAYWMDQGALLRIAAEELRAHGNREAALRIAERGVEWWRRQEADDLRARRNLAATLYLAETWEDAREVYGELARLHPEDATVLGRLGAVAAREGDREKALEISARLAELFAKLEPAARNCAQGEHALRRAGIAALLGRKDEAVRLVRESIAQGLQHAGIDGDCHIEPDLAPLHGYAAYEQLMEPEV